MCAIRTVPPACRTATGRDPACDRTLRHASPVPHTVVFFHAHPDDEALLTSGTMATAGRAGPSGGAGGGHRRRGRTGGRRAHGRRRPRRPAAAPNCDGLGGGARGAPARGARLRRLRAGAAIRRRRRRPGRRRGSPTPTSATSPDGWPRSWSPRRRERADHATTRNGGYGHPDHVAVHRGRRGAAADLAGTPVVLEATVPRDRLLAAARTVNRLLPAVPAGRPRARGRGAYSALGGRSPTASTSGPGARSAGRRCGRTPARRRRTAGRARWGSSPGSRRRCSAGCSAGSGTGRPTTAGRRRALHRAVRHPLTSPPDGQRIGGRGPARCPRPIRRRRCGDRRPHRSPPGPTARRTRCDPRPGPTARPARPARRTGSPGCG